MLDLKDETRGIKTDQRPAPSRGWRLKKIGRLFAFCFVASVIGAGLSLRSVHADAEDAAMGLGQELGKLGDTGKRVIRLNEQSMHVFSVSEDVGVDALLDRVETACRDGSPAGGVFDGLSPAARQHLPMDPADARAAGVLRKDEGDSGVVACLIKEEGAQSPGNSEMISRMQQFMRSGDLSAIGKLRYVYARETAPGRSHVVTAWTDGTFDVSALMPKNGADTPGADSAFLPRPASAVRLLTADVQGVPYALRLYDAAGAPPEVLASYEASLLDSGWASVPSELPNARSYTRGPIDAMVMVQPNRQRTMVSVVEMRPR
jgi:hypothetical protein